MFDMKEEITKANWAYFNVPPMTEAEIETLDARRVAIFHGSMMSGGKLPRATVEYARPIA